MRRISRWLAVASSVGLAIVVVGWTHWTARVPEEVIGGRVGGQAIDARTDDGWIGFSPAPPPPKPAPFDYVRRVRCDDSALTAAERMRFAASKSGFFRYCWETVEAGTIPKPAEEVEVW